MEEELIDPRPNNRHAFLRRLPQVPFEREMIMGYSAIISAQDADRGNEIRRARGLIFTVVGVDFDITNVEQGQWVQNLLIATSYFADNWSDPEARDLAAIVRDWLKTYYSNNVVH